MKMLLASNAAIACIQSNVQQFLLFFFLSRAEQNVSLSWIFFFFKVIVEALPLHAHIQCLHKL